MSVFKFIENLNSRNLGLTIWKSFDRYEEFLNGQTDIDIFSVENFNKISYEFENLGVKKFYSEKYRKFNDVHDYFYLTQKDEKPLILHLHFFNEIRTGTSFTKNLLIPKSFYNVHKNKDGFYSVNKADSNIIDFIRHVYKFRILNYYYSLKNKDKTHLYLDKEIKRNFVDSLNQEINNNLKKLKLTKDKKLLALLVKKDSFITDFKIRRQVKKLTKNFVLYNFFYEKLSFYKKLFHKKLFKSGKEVANSNLIVAFVAPDGSGKSTISLEVFNFFNKQFKTRLIYLGISKKIKKLRRKVSNNLDSGSKSKLSLIKHLYNSFSSLMVSFVKFWLFVKIKYFIKNSIIILDRYPLENIDSMPSYKNSLFKSLETKFNKLKPELDLLIYIDVSPEIIKKRNKFNIDEINKRSFLYRKDLEKQDILNITHVNNDHDLNLTLSKSINSIWDLF